VATAAGPEPAYRDQLAVWDTAWQERRPPVNSFARRCAKRWFPLLGSRRRVLELGCGAGADALFLARHGCEVVATDFARTALLVTGSLAAGSGLAITVEPVDLRTGVLPFADGAFQAVYAHLSLHYFSDSLTRALVADCARVLQPGGLLCLKCKSIDDPLFGQGESLDLHRFVRNGHVRHFFSRAEMATLLADWNILHLRRTAGAYGARPSAFVEAVARRRT
jgi:SAM-dependent methyltransferase